MRAKMKHEKNSFKWLAELAMTVRYVKTKQMKAVLIKSVPISTKESYGDVIVVPTWIVSEHFFREKISVVANKH